MKITSLETFHVPPRWLFLKVSTDEGLAGWGEPVLEGHADSVETAVKEMGEYLQGKEAGNIEDIWQVLYRGGFYRGGPILTSAISGIEQALWDLKGKRLGVPIYELLGGAVREKMRIYSQSGYDVADARARIAAGYTALKIVVTDQLDWIDSPAHVLKAAERMATLREAVGYDVRILVDIHGRARKGMAKLLARELEPFKPFFLEEPVLPENNEALAELAAITSTPLATGERMYTRWGFKDLLARGSIDVVQPDISHTGGIWETRKIAAMAEAYDVAIAPHCPLGPIAFAASLQLDFCTPNALIQEQVLYDRPTIGSRTGLEYLVDPQVLVFKEGFIQKLTGPGLGIEINEDKVRAMARVGYSSRHFGWRTSDGAVAEW